MKSLFTCFILSISLTVFGQNKPQIIEDLYVGTNPSTPTSFVHFHDSIFFIARRSGTTDSIYRSKVGTDKAKAIASKLTIGQTVGQIIGNLVLWTLPNGNKFDTLLTYVVKRGTTFELHTYNGKTDSAYTNNNLSALSSNFFNTTLKTVRSIQINSGINQFSGKLEFFLLINADVDSISLPTRPVFMLLRSPTNVNWQHYYDNTQAVNALIIPTLRGWFLIKNLNYDSKKIEFDIADGQPTFAECTTNATQCSDYNVPIAAFDSSAVIYSSINNVNRLRYFKDSLRRTSAPLGLIVKKAGVILNKKFYFTTTNDGIFETDTSLTLAFLPSFEKVNGVANLTPDNVTRIGNRVFFTANLPANAPNASIFEILRGATTTTRPVFQFRSGETFTSFLDVDSVAYVLTKINGNDTIYRIQNSDSTKIKIGAMPSFDPLAGWASLGDTLVFSGITATASGREPHRLKLIPYCSVDNEPPVFSRTCPMSFAVSTVSNSRVTTAQVPTWLPPMATDICNTNPSVNFVTLPTVGLQNGGNFPIGQTTVTYTASDGTNIITCNFTVTVSNPCASDNQPPLMTCPRNVDTAIVGDCVKLRFPTAAVIENCVFYRLDSNFVRDSCFKIGTHNLTFTATDDRTNSGTCTFVVKVTKKVNPTIELDPTILSMSLEPNPTEGAVIIALETTAARTMTFDVFDAAGKRCRQETRAVGIGTQRLSFDWRDLPRGFFIVVPSNSDRKILKPLRFVKI